MGVETVMLTGDDEAAARGVADDLGIDDVRAGLLPDEKVDAVDELESDRTVAMVGDGVIDAPALATATVAAAMGAAGTDTAIETADVALMADDLGRLPYAFSLARSGRGVIKQNVWGSLLVETTLAVAAPLGLIGPVLAVLLGDAGLTLGVTGNALRLARLGPD
ncbi:MAG: Cd2+/Zn2+-exporting ATPase [Halobacteriales archaeon]|jgi:Cd2+/Zn2+-exporting ATPase